MGTTIARLAAALALALGATAPSSGDEAGDEVTSVAQGCINQNTVKRTKVLNDRTILFVTRDRQNYLNQLPRQCPSMKRNSLLNYAVANNRYCAGGSVTVLWQTGNNSYAPAVVCQLGMFLPASEDEVADIMAMTAAPDTPRQRRRSERDMVKTERVELPPPAADAETEPTAP